MPVPPKPAERRQRRNRPAEVGLVLAPPVTAELPAPPRELLADTVRAWEGFWRSPLATVVTLETDLPALERLFTLYDERCRAYRAFRRARVVEGSQGQAVLNPLGRQMLAYDAEIRQLEDRFGLTPMARLRLGVQLGAAQRTLADLNRALEEEERGDEEDPRLQAVAAAQPRR